jgi:hypothetical protein
VRYGGNWNPEPYALERCANAFRYQTGYNLAIDPVDLVDLNAARWPLAFLTGTEAATFTAAQTQAVRRYVEEGGTLLIDAAGSSADFARSVGELLRAALPDRPRLALPATHAIFGLRPDAAEGMESLPRPLLRPGGRPVGEVSAVIEMVTAGRGRVLFSPVDWTFAQLGTNTWGITGYRPAYAQALLKNIVLWTMDGAP